MKKEKEEAYTRASGLLLNSPNLLYCVFESSTDEEMEGNLCVGQLCLNQVLFFHPAFLFVRTRLFSGCACGLVSLFIFQVNAPRVIVCFIFPFFKIKKRVTALSCLGRFVPHLPSFLIKGGAAFNTNVWSIRPAAVGRIVGNNFWPCGWRASCFASFYSTEKYTFVVLCSVIYLCCWSSLWRLGANFTFVSI